MKGVGGRSKNQVALRKGGMARGGIQGQSSSEGKRGFLRRMAEERLMHGQVSKGLGKWENLPV